MTKKVTEASEKVTKEWPGCPAIWVGTSRDQKNFMQENFGLIFRTLLAVAFTLAVAMLVVMSDGQLCLSLRKLLAIFSGCAYGGGPKVTERHPKMQIFAENRRFRFSYKTEDFRMKPQIGLRHFRSVAFSSVA